MTLVLKAVGTLLVIGGLLVIQYDPEKSGNLVAGYFAGQQLERLAGGALILVLGVCVWMWTMVRESKGK
ncbi:MAG: hypothetical protein B7Z38_02535 [Rhodobacterales bacterium 12-64-8]|nr:MAG: hypothetical protein B7Z38_02535 [Rhodobacterales bacterium 12-64-8]OYX50253.1 MAG: hypothetical protein B7Y90_04545 [Alphaproteobacteria bacterium 32-64-14]